jgi:predicted ATPase
MNATIAWSYQTPDPRRARVLFRRLARALGYVSRLRPATAVLGGGQDVLRRDDTALAGAAGLIDKTFCCEPRRQSAVPPLFQMLETVRAYAARELTASGERDHALEGSLAIACDEASSRRPG